MPLVKLDVKSQIVLPVNMRKRLSIKPGDILQLIEKNDTIIISKAPASYVDELERCASSIWRGYETELNKSRDQYDL